MGAACACIPLFLSGVATIQMIVAASRSRSQYNFSLKNQVNKLIRENSCSFVAYFKFLKCHGLFNKVQPFDGLSTPGFATRFRSWNGTHRN